MSPSAIIPQDEVNEDQGLIHLLHGSLKARFNMDRDLNLRPMEVAKASGSYVMLKNGRRIFDAAGGAAVACLGYGNQEIKELVNEQMDKISYCNSQLFTTGITSDLTEELIAGTGVNKKKGGKVYNMSKVLILSSGSEATEAALKMGRQHFQELSPPQLSRTKYIARKTSYHGTTLGALSLSGHLERRRLYEPLLMTEMSWISSCNAYRQRLPSESDESFVARKAAELDAEFLRQGPETVIGFVCEPVSGAALGCVPYVPGYLAAMKAVCKKNGALFILDEVMCGMGRTGTLHAWQAEHDDSDPTMDCVPDLQMVGKGLAGGYMPIAAVIVGHDVTASIQAGTGCLAHGQTYQAHPLASAAALAVQRIIRRDDLLSNVRTQGAYLSSLLHQKLDAHPNVGDIRGLGLFCGIEFVKDKATKMPFDPALKIATKLVDRAVEEPYNITFYPGQGTMDGKKGDHIIVSPAYIVTREDVELIVHKLAAVIDEFFKELTAVEEPAVVVNGHT